MDAPHLILASASPRRRELLERLGLRLAVKPADIDEAPRAGERPAEYVRRIAAEKCDVAAGALDPGLRDLPVLAADTTVILGGANGEILGKPADEAEAADMLRRLSGRRHEVTTAYRVRRGEPAAEGSPEPLGTVIDRAVTTSVTFRLLAPAEVDAYVASGEWRGKAGGYAIQGIAAVFVTDVRGSITNVIGLPLAEVVADLRAAGGLPTWPEPGFGAGVTG